MYKIQHAFRPEDLMALLEKLILFFCLFFNNSYLFKQARHMVTPYPPMLVPPVKWTGYDNFSFVLQLLLLLPF